MDNLTQVLTRYGLTEEILLLLVFIPILATLINVARYIIGFKTLGVYASMTLAFAYIFTGIRFGLLVTVAVILSTLISYTFLKKIRMHYISRIAVNYILITFLVIGILIINESSPISITTDRHNIETIPPLGIILIATLSDFFVKQFVKKDFTTALRYLGETVLVAIAGWGLMRWGEFSDFVLRNFWIHPILLILNLTLGKYSGMRLKEYFRFTKIFQRE